MMATEDIYDGLLAYTFCIFLALTQNKTSQNQNKHKTYNSNQSK